MNDWAAISDYVNISTAFSESLRSLSVYDAMLPSITPAPLRSRGITVTTGISGGVIGERGIKVIGKLSLGTALVEPQKSVAIVITTQEVARSGDANTAALFDSELRKAVVFATDSVFLAALAAASTPVASAGASFVNVMTDMGALLDGVTTHANSRLFYIASPANIKRLLLKSNTLGSPAFPGLRPGGGEALPGIVAIASDSIPSGVVLLVDATGIAGSADIIALDSSDKTSLQMDTSPDSPPIATTTLVNLFQQDLVALRAERFFGFTVLRNNAVASLSGVAY
jgi:hypothetical protein